MCIRIRSFSGPYYPAFGLNTKIYKVILLIQSKSVKTQTRKTRIRTLSMRCKVVTTTSNVALKLT